MAIGAFRPRILSPSRLCYTAEELSLVLRHELTHCRRHDLLFCLLAADAACIVQPLFLLIQRMMERIANWPATRRCWARPLRIPGAGIAVSGWIPPPGI